MQITNTEGYVTVRDNGRGVADFAKLLDLGSSGWHEVTEASEDPCGVGLFCLAPREVTVRSGGKTVTFSGDGWPGAPVAVRHDPEPVSGTAVRFEDEPRNSMAVDLNAVFCGLQVTVDGRLCPSARFLSEDATRHPELGCRVEVRHARDLNPWHHAWKRGQVHGANTLVNFHGQVVTFDHHAVSERDLHFLVDMTGEPTDVPRCLAPARRSVVSWPGSAVSRGRLTKDGLIELRLREKALQPPVLSIQLLEPLGLIQTHASVFLAPPVVGLLGHGQLLADLRDLHALGQLHLGFPKLGDDLFRRMSLPAHDLALSDCVHGLRIFA